MMTKRTKPAAAEDATGADARPERDKDAAGAHGSDVQIVGIVFLDNSLHVRRFTNSATRIIKLIPSDVGRPLSDIVTELDYPSLLQDCQEVLHTLAFAERDMPTHDARWFLVRVMPYRTAENVIDGVVITFIDVGKTKATEKQLREALLRGDGAGAVR